MFKDRIDAAQRLANRLEWVKKENPTLLVIPVGPRDTIERLSKMAEVVVLDAPESFGAVGEFYHSFDQVEDYQVIEIMSSHGFRSKNLK